jgi:predicted  nucleic acid-binding Zn-ribbon protein
MTAPDPFAPRPIQIWLDRLTAAQPDDHDRRLASLEAQMTTSTVAVAALAQMIDNLEGRMSATDDKVNELSSKLDAVSGNVTNIISDVDNLQAEVERLQAELEAQDPALAAKLQPLVDKIQGLSDTTKILADSVPDAPAGGGEPTREPAPGGGEVTNPTPVDENGNPV